MLYSQVCGLTTIHTTPTPLPTQCPTCTYTRASAHIQCDMCGFNPTHTPTTTLKDPPAPFKPSFFNALNMSFFL